MTQFSMFWTTTPPAAAVGDGSSPYTSTNWFDFLRSLTTFNATSEGVLAGYLNQLAVSGAGSPLTVATGGAVVYGIPYKSDASENVTVATPAIGDTGGHVILRADWTAQTVRVVAVRNTDGNAAIPALTQTAGTTWEVRLATFTISTLGVITLTDARDYCHFNSGLIYRRRGNSASDWSVQGNNIYTPAGVLFQSGVFSLAFAASPTSNLTNMVFPQAYSKPPIVFTTVNASITPGDLQRVISTVQTITATTFDSRCYHTPGTNITTDVQVQWLSIGEV